MQDQLLYQDMLMLEKGVCDLYMHGAIESSTNNISEAFKCALNDSLTMQNEIYRKMESKGWYQTENADQSQISALKLKYAQNMQG